VAKAKKVLRHQQMQKADHAHQKKAIIKNSTLLGKFTSTIPSVNSHHKESKMKIGQLYQTNRFVKPNIIQCGNKKYKEVSCQNLR